MTWYWVSAQYVLSDQYVLLRFDRQSQWITMQIYLRSYRGNQFLKYYKAQHMHAAWN
jgi:hypothetical protein